MEFVREAAMEIASSARSLNIISYPVNAYIWSKASITMAFEAW
jgi:hypothetical protein